jgi:5S rRNA maturation endonuclease (ribonuclease M5)
MTDGGGRLWFAPSLPDFTPGITLADVDLSGAQLPKQFAQRITGCHASIRSEFEYEIRCFADKDNTAKVEGVS